MTKRKKALIIIAIILAVLILLMAGIFINHKIRLNNEKELLAPLGKLVEVDGHNMSIYTEGNGEATLVFMSGGGTCSPILDFRSLYSLMSDDYTIAVVEKFGYGFSDVVDRSRDIDTMLEDTRAALTAAGMTAPYILCPHSMSGLEALYWAQKYPEEITAIIGLDMAVPKYYESMEINSFMLSLSSWAADFGITRLLPGISESEAILHGTLTEQEKDIYRAVFYTRTATSTMLKETEAVKDNAKLVESKGAPQLPMLLFISDGSGGTAFDKDTWRSIPKEYIAQVEDGEYIELDCPHYVHDHEYQLISEKIREFLAEDNT